MSSARPIWRHRKRRTGQRSAGHVPIVEQFAKFVRPDLWKEHSEGEDLDYMFGIGVPEGYGISGSDWRRGMAAKFSLIHRVREVNANQSTVSEYTIEFAKLFAERWDCSKEYVEPPPEFPQGPF